MIKRIAAKRFFLFAILNMDYTLSVQSIRSKGQRGSVVSECPVCKKDFLGFIRIYSLPCVRLCTADWSTIKDDFYSQHNFSNLCRLSSPIPFWYCVTSRSSKAACNTAITPLGNIKNLIEYNTRLY